SGMPCSELREKVDEPDPITLPTPGYRVRRHGGNPGASRAPRALLLPAPRLLSKLWGRGDGRAAAEADTALLGRFSGTTCRVARSVSTMTFQASRKIAAPPSCVFAAFEDSARLAVWWGPAGFTNTFKTYEFKPGGKWSFTMHGPDGKNYPNEIV